MEKKKFEEIIKAHLDEVAKKDELFAKSYKKKGKSIEKCCQYIIGEVKKFAKDNVAACTDEEVYGLAIHYYDEDDVEPSETPVNATVVATAADKSEKKPKRATKRTKKQPAKEEANGTPENYELDIPIF